MPTLNFIFPQFYIISPDFSGFFYNNDDGATKRPLFPELFLTTVNLKLKLLSAGQETKEG